MEEENEKKEETSESEEEEKEEKKEKKKKEEKEDSKPHHSSHSSSSSKPNSTKILTLVVTITLILTLINTFGIFSATNMTNTAGAAVDGGDAPAPPTPSAPAPTVDVEIKDAPIKGVRTAPVTIIEFSDYECPFCSRFYSQTLPQIQKEYIDTGKVVLAYRDFPLSFHQNAQKAAESARCVREQTDDEGYFEMHDQIFENQGSLSLANLKLWAKEIDGVDGTEFDTCLDSGKTASAVQADFQDGQAYGVRGTPGFFINGKLISGAQPFSVFQQAIEAELAS